MHASEIDVLDDYIARQGVVMSRPEAVRRILHDWFVSHGYSKAVNPREPL